MLYPGLPLKGDPPDYMTFLTDKVTRYYGNVKQVEWMDQEPHKPRPAEEKSEYGWDEVTRMVSNLGHSRYPLLHPDVTVPAQQLPKHMMSSENIEALYVAWFGRGMRCPVRG